MSPSRILIANTVIGVILLGSLWDIATDSEHWPFSSYQMFSRLRSDRVLIRPRLYGVPQEENREIPLWEKEHIEPFDPSRLAKAFMKMQGSPNSGALFEAALRDLLKRYEKRRSEGKHNGPRLAALRLYELSWQLDPKARNLYQPEGKTLLAEVRAS